MKNEYPLLQIFLNETRSAALLPNHLNSTGLCATFMIVGSIFCISIGYTYQSIRQISISNAFTASHPFCPISQTGRMSPSNNRPFSRRFGMKPNDAKHFRAYLRVMDFSLFVTPILLNGDTDFSGFYSLQMQASKWLFWFSALEFIWWSKFLSIVVKTNLKHVHGRIS